MTACGGVAVEEDRRLIGVVFGDGLAVTEGSGGNGGWHVLDELSERAVACLPERYAEVPKLVVHPIGGERLAGPQAGNSHDEVGLAAVFMFGRSAKC